MSSQTENNSTTIKKKKLPFPRKSNRKKQAEATHTVSLSNTITIVSD